MPEPAQNPETNPAPKGGDVFQAAQLPSAGRRGRSLEAIIREDLQPHIEGVMLERWGKYGYDFYPTIYEIVSADTMNELAAYGGFPTRYPHWRFGMEYERMSRGYTYGLQKIYEMVINNDPSYAYLMANNEMVDHKLVITHVTAHVDFFKNNLYFRHTNRKAVDMMANHGQRIRGFMDRYGREVVEAFIDKVSSIEGLIDVHSTFFQRTDRASIQSSLVGPEEVSPVRSGRLRAKGYMDPFINPASALKEESERLEASREKTETSFPAEPRRDVMLFVLENSIALQPWQQDVLAMLREEAYYFAPQGQTKIMNEGWASFWHSIGMTQDFADSSDIIQYADHCSGTFATSGKSLNPYKLGVELYRDIMERWTTGRHGPEYDACEDFEQRKNWCTEDPDEGYEKAMKEIFFARRVHNDVTFIDSYLTLDFVRQHKLFQFGYNQSHEVYEIESREFPAVKQQLLDQLANRGRPEIWVLDGNFRNRGELLLGHRFTGPELQLGYAKDTLESLYSLWGRPVRIATKLDNTWQLVGFDGSEHTVEEHERPDYGIELQMAPDRPVEDEDE